MIGTRIRQLRIEKGLSLSELAECAGVAKSYLSRIERGIQSNPSIEFLEKIASVFSLTVEALLQENPVINENPDKEWHHLIKKAIDSGISIEELQAFLDYSIWRLNQKE
ncbi:helix-turn-helix domain-containing protein [Paenibacillus wynnii]|uniref:helix-turn-helix domain-containing protein n=1 Tax=Paenibacillus wynnii TaxID=268407 RepID=UPI00278F3CDD|nr:helix-turn-helix domain-containing protein [Paenibacillus wynnii]MDQ0193924.1 XRE family transcriptional regulator of biofilm formation [Paenibacillus wynnii]